MNLLIFYKSTLSFLLKALLGGGCRFSPTCSEYAYEAISTHGSLAGSKLTLKRVLKCHPWGSTGFDPVPPKGDNT